MSLEHADTTKLIDLKPEGIDNDVNETKPDDIDNDVNETKLRWENIPIVPLTVLFSYLNDKGRASAARTCKTWLSAFRTPSLWRKRTYRFGGYRSSQKTIEKMLQYGSELGNHLRYLHLFCEHPTFITCKQLQRGLATFFDAITWKKGKLFHFQFNSLQCDRYWRFDFLRQRLVSAISRFIRGQRDINCFEMNRATLPPKQGIRIIESLVSAAGYYISAVNMEDYFAPRTSLFCLERFRMCMSRFHNLTIMQTNYNYLSENIIKTLCKNCGANFIFLSMKVYRFDPHTHKIDSLTWMEIKKTCPHLSVRVSFEGIGDYSNITRVLTKGMPLANLNIWTGLRHIGDNWRTNDMLTYITENFGKSIEEISLSLETGPELIDEHLLKLLESSPNLEYLDIQAPVTVPTIEAICKLQAEFKLGLLKCHIITEKLSTAEIEEMASVEKRYELMFYERGLDFLFSATNFPYY